MKRWRELILGILAGGIFVAILVVTGFASFLLGNRLIDYLDLENRAKVKVDYSRLKKDFRIGFEIPEDRYLFQGHEASVVITDLSASGNEKALKVEFPSGREYPGMAMEVYGRECFDWGDMTEFTFDVYNEIVLDAPLTIKLRSGADYPKKDYEVGITIPARTKARCRVTRRELEGKLDLRKISGINLFMSDPRTSYILYFDNFVVQRKAE
jgi:hypothetical protein